MSSDVLGRVVVESLCAQEHDVGRVRIALSDGSWPFCASKPESLWMGGIGRLVQASGKGMTRDDSGGITHLPQALL